MYLERYMGVTAKLTRWLRKSCLSNSHMVRWLDKNPWMDGVTRDSFAYLGSASPYR